MEDKLFRNKYRIALDAKGAPVELWHSGLGVTYRAEDVETGRQVALELVPSASLKPAVRERLQAEANSAKQVTHINIPGVHDFGFDAEHMFYVMEPVEGATAEAWVAANGPMPGAAVLRVALQVLGALGAAAFHGIVHHAIKPKNLLLVEGQTVGAGWPLLKLLNLIGVAPAFWSANDGASAFDSFASPEQLTNGRVDFRSEIYSLGCTLWFLLTGAPPFASLPAAVGARPMEMVLDLEKHSQLPKRAKRLLLQMLAVDPNERPHDPLALYGNFQDCLNELERDGASGRAPAAVILPPVIKLAPAPVAKQRRTFAVAPVAIAAVLIALVTLALGWPERFGPAHLLGLRGRSKELGVPIGVPEEPSVPLTAQGAPNAEQSTPLHQDTAVALHGGAAPDEPPAPGSTPEVETNRVAQVDAGSRGTNSASVESPRVLVPVSNDSAAPPPSPPANIAVASTDAGAATGPEPSAPEPPAAGSAVESDVASRATSSAPQESPGTLVSISSGSAALQPSLPANSPVTSTDEGAATGSERRALLPPPAPAEGPEEALVTVPDQNTSRVSGGRDSTPPPTSESRDQSPGGEQTKSVAATTPRSSNSRADKAAIKSSKNLRASAKKKSRIAKDGSIREAKPARAPGGTVRARFVGTTSDGQWIVDVPSSGPGVVALPPGSSDYDTSSRRPARGVSVEPVPTPDAANRPPRR